MAASPSIHRLTYVSTVTRPLQDVELDALVAQARANNVAHGITGLLLFNGLNFLQTLEGEGDAVARVFGSIAADPRHHGVVRVHAEDANERAFGAWSMAYSPVVRSGTQGSRLGSNGFSWTGRAALPSQLESLYLAFNSLGRAVSAPA